MNSTKDADILKINKDKYAHYLGLLSQLKSQNLSQTDYIASLHKIIANDKYTI